MGCPERRRERRGRVRTTLELLLALAMAVGPTLVSAAPPAQRVKGSAASPSRKLPPYEAALAAADALIRGGRYAEALSKAREAIQLDERRFAAWYYAALSLYGDDFPDEALGYLDAGQGKGGEEERASAERLRGAIQRRKALAEATQAADAALFLGSPKE